MMGKLSLYFVNALDRERQEQIRIAEEAVKATLKAEQEELTKVSDELKVLDPLVPKLREDLEKEAMLVLQRQKKLDITLEQNSGLQEREIPKNQLKLRQVKYELETGSQQAEQIVDVIDESMGEEIEEEEVEEQPTPNGLSFLEETKERLIKEHEQELERLR